ncbi:hypothetical protein FDF12_04050 [Clostridium botulinum]|nr:hypothetical protein [Clostridium botulinum]NFS52684.1 hypothetical protein [Clostridium botulinum]NFT16599.1 hypothetical protein [Clostridium botulinum]
MIPFNFNKKSQKERKIIVDEYYNLITKGRSVAKLKVLNNWCINNIIIGGKRYSFYDVVTAEFAELDIIQKYLSSCKIDFSSLIKEKTGKDGKIHKRCYIKDTLYGSMPKEARDKLLNALDLTVCPYCNRNYINKAGTKTTCHFDHFFSKDSYPILAVSFYNLVPVCPACNTVKGVQECSYSPYDIGYTANELLTFSYMITDPDYLVNKDSINVIINESIKYKDNVTALGLRDLYKLHNDVVQEILKKAIALKGYSHSLNNSFKNLFKDQDEVSRIIIGNYVKEEDFYKRPLAKMMSDISRKVGIIK